MCVSSDIQCFNAQQKAKISGNLIKSFKLLHLTKICAFALALSVLCASSVHVNVRVSLHGETG